MTTARDRLEQHRGRFLTRDLGLELWLSISVNGFIDRVAHLMSDEEAAPRARLMDLVASSSGSFKLDLQSIVDLLSAAE